METQGIRRRGGPPSRWQPNEVRTEMLESEAWAAPGSGLDVGPSWRRLDLGWLFDRDRSPISFPWSDLACYAAGVGIKKRTWCQPSPLVSPDRVRAMKDRGELTAVRQAEY